MDSFTFNKIAGAVLGTCLIGMGLGIVAQGIYEPSAPKKPGYALPNPKPEEAGGGAKAPAEIPLPVLLAKADAKKGENTAKVCGACHNFTEGGGTKVGPDLYGVVDREKASVPGFDYSSALKSKGGKWTFADLNEWLTSPQKYAPGTKMSYPGEEDAQKRADIIAYLRTLSKTPVPLPKPTPEEEKIAKGEAAGGGAKGGEKAAGGGGDDLVKLIADTPPAKGEQDAKVCGLCHNFKEGEGAKVGPDLYGVVDREKASEQGFAYSAALKSKGGKWTYQDLNEWLTNPQKYAPGTKMGFAGEPDLKKRAAIISYLRSLAKTPAPLPAAAEAKGGGE
ncbi:MAG: c-type cytochrome, partial [Caulobacteraceae bacterium]|nr:c-type cytochrome [Caulobacter sp.]